MKKHLPYLLTILRILIGWHFLYEGITKLLTRHGVPSFICLDQSGFLPDCFIGWIVSHCLESR